MIPRWLVRIGPFLVSLIIVGAFAYFAGDAIFDAVMA